MALKTYTYLEISNTIKMKKLRLYGEISQSFLQVVLSLEKEVLPHTREESVPSQYAILYVAFLLLRFREPNVLQQTDLSSFNV